MPGVERAPPATRSSARQGDLVVLLEGGLAMGSNDGGEHIAAFSVDEDAPDPAILYTIPAGARLHADAALGLSRGRRPAARRRCCPAGRRAKSLAALDDGVRERIASLMKAQPFKQMSFEHLVRCAEAMQEVEVGDGEEIVTQGEPGDYFYVIKAGTADVLRARTAAAAAARWQRWAPAPASARRRCSRASRATPRCA